MTTTKLQASFNWWGNFNKKLYLQILELKNNMNIGDRKVIESGTLICIGFHTDGSPIWVSEEYYNQIKDK